MPGRKYSAGTSYRYGFNGKEQDNDIGNLTDYDYGFRIYNPALGRFLSVDPLSGKYPFYTPYSFSGNKPIQCVDVDGQEETIPYIQSAAFDRIATSSPGVSYVRGKDGDKLATQLPQEESDWFDQFFKSVSPIRMAPVEPAPHIAQAINFGNSVGSVVYDLASSEKGEYKAITNGGEAMFSNNQTVYLQISGYSDVGQAVIQNLKTTNDLNGLTDVEIAGYIESVKFIFEPGKDYSKLFWNKTGELTKPNAILAQIGPATLPTPTYPILMPPLSGSPNNVNTATGSVIISTEAISQEIAATLAPSLVQMAHKKKQSQSSGSTKKGGVKASTHEHGESHGSLKSKKGNKPNPNQRKKAKDHGGKTN